MDNIIPNDINNSRNKTSNNKNFVTGPPNGQDESSGLFSNGFVQPLSSSYINPINIKTIKQYISIDSKFRPNYFNTKSTNFEINLSNSYSNIISMTLHQISLPSSYYSISKTLGNSTFTVTVLGVITSITLPDGNYSPTTSTSFGLTALETSINTQLPGTISFSVDRISGRAMFLPAAATPTAFQIRFNVDSNFTIDPNTALPLRAGWQLGFRTAYYDVDISTPCISEGICMLTGPQYAFLSINDYQKNEYHSYTAMYSSSILQKNILDRLELASTAQQVMSGELFCVINPSITSSSRIYFGPVNINRLKIGLYDEYGRIIDLNNMDWSFVLELDTVYK